MKDLIKKITEQDITEIQGLALVTKTSYEVVFYGKINGEIVQSNNMVEMNLIDSVLLDDFYSEMAKKVKELPDYKEECMNIFTFDDKSHFELKTEEKARSLYSIKKHWKESVMKILENNWCEIIVCGPPHSGKSVFAASLEKLLPADGYETIRVHKDGEGDWSNNPNRLYRKSNPWNSLNFKITKDLSGEIYWFC